MKMKIVSTLLIVLCLSTVLYAQQATSAAIPRRIRSCPCPRRIIKSAATVNTAVPPSPDFFVGEAKVDVTRDDTVVRLAMAQHGSVLIELPANDGPRYIIPGDPEMATVDQKALERNKRSIIVRPGTLFVSPRNTRARAPAATVTAQMRSGLVVTFLFYPVEDLAQNVHRCVLRYNRDEVIARRRAVGLPVNLDMETRGELTVQSAAPTSISVEGNSEGAIPTSPKPSNSPSAKPAPDPPSPTPSTPPKAVAEPLSKSEINEMEIASIRDALQQAMKEPNRFKYWTRAQHGLTLSALAKPISNETRRLLIVAVKNKSSKALKLSPTSPELFLELVDDQGKPLNIQSIKNVHSEPSDRSGLIQPGATTYFAIAYVAPTKGAHQRIRLTIAHTNAADEPAAITITDSGE